MLSKQERARQFLPFDALNGLREALLEKEIEIEYVEKIELSEDSLEKISETLNTIDKNDNVRIIYYKNKQYKEIFGEVQEISSIKKRLILYEDVKVYFFDILEIEKI